MHGCLAVEATVKEWAGKLKEAGCDVERTEETVVARDGDVIVYRALRKGGPGQPWIVMCRDSDRIKWTKPD